MLFGADVPQGFDYRDAFITPEEEAALAHAIAEVEFSAFKMRGVVARRRVAFFGQSYDEGPARPVPDFLLPLRARTAAWVGTDPAAFAMALINRYEPGAPIGWHRDAPQYDMVAGVSLLSACRMKLRPYVAPRAAPRPGQPPRRSTHEIVLQPRSAYLIRDVARSAYEHSIPAVASLRYSITFRTLRG